MKNNFRNWALVSTFGTFSLVAVAVGITANPRFINSFTEPQHAATENRARVPKADKGEDNEGDVFERSNWFLQQRLYGSKEIPTEARLRAKAEADLVAPQLSGRFAPNAAVWTGIGPQPLESLFPTAYGDVSGRINWIAVSPADSNIVLVGAATGGIWRSTNALADPNSAAPPIFAPVSDAQVDLAVGSIAFAASNPAIVYAAMGDADNTYLGTGVLKSIDAGATWTRLAAAGLPAQGLGQKIAVNANDPNTIYLTRSETRGDERYYPSLSVEAGFYRTNDGGANWTRTLAGKITSFVASPANPNVIYAVALDSAQPGAVAKGIYKSIDAGQTFAAVGNAPSLEDATDFRVDISQSDAQKIYFFGAKEKSSSKIHVAVDNGSSIAWTSNTVPLSRLDTEQFGYNTYLVADPFVAGRLYVGSRDVFRVNMNTATNNVGTIEDVTNGFAWSGTEWSFQPQNSKAHVDQQHLAFGSAATFFISHDGGLQRTGDAGATFTKNMNQSLSFTQVVGMSIHPTDVTKAYIGTQDNGTQRRVSGTMWKEFVGGDGGQTQVDPTDPSRIFTSYINGNIFRVDNNGIGEQGAQINESFPGRRILFYPPIVVNGFDSTLYVGTETLAVCTDCATVMGIGNWTFPAGGTGVDLTRGGGDILSAIAAQKTAYGAGQTIYVGSTTGAFRVSQDGGATFTDRTANLDNAVHNGNVPTQNPGRYVSSIKIDPANQGTAFITVSGFGTRHVFKSTDFGATIAALNFTIDIPTSDFLIDPLAPTTTYYIGTDIGVFRSLDAGASWNQFNNGLPPAVVTRLASAPSGRIVAGTYGRGVYQNLTPTAASVTVAGRITQPNGRAVGSVRVTLTDANGETRRAVTNFAGYYRFTDVSAGSTYTFEASSKRWQFSDNPRIINVTEAIEDLNFTVGK